MHTHRWGELGATALLVHGSVANGEMSWRRQRPLAERWSLLVLDRRGYYPNPPIQHEDFEVDVADVAELLVRRGPAHLVGHSYGAVISLLVAARVPEHVRSLTVIEPPAFGVVPDDADVRGMVAGMREYWEEGPRNPEAFLRGFLERAGAVMRLPSPLPPPLAQSAALLRDYRSPGEAVIPLEELCRASFPKLVVSGGHHPVYEKICDTIADGIGGRRVVIEGAGHTVQATGEPFNDELERLWTSAAAVASFQR